ncbi:MAG TPA: hypothetical protein VE987_01050 [Polyangiaceae bacterium]|nr:hypothetical protein [Polyangiaceae bacterium]
MTGRRAVLLLLFAGCKPDLGPDDSLVTSARILAVKAEPPEAKPGSSATYTALVASPAGTADDAAIAWRWCVAPKSPAENDIVSTACLGGAALLPAGDGQSVTAASPSDGCELFGPDTPPGGFRPRDPDPTGGYYQPLRGDLAGSPPVFDLTRILCSLAVAPADLASEYARQYVPNANPHLQPLVARIGGAIVALDAIARASRVELEASWSPADAETYTFFDSSSQSLTTKRESMRVAWYATAGALDTESTGRAEDDPLTTSDNSWTAPSAGAVYLWVVLRDSRGGVDFASYRLDVVP